MLARSNRVSVAPRSEVRFVLPGRGEDLQNSVSCSEARGVEVLGSVLGIFGDQVFRMQQ